MGIEVSELNELRRLHDADLLGRLDRLERQFRALWRGTLVALLILTLGTVVVTFRQQGNFDDHVALDAHACRLATTNRALIAESLSVIADDPSQSQATRDKLAQIQAQITKLIVGADCDDV